MNDKTETEKFACPCCGYRTLSTKPQTLEICKVCFWEDDPFQFDNPDNEGWSNGVSLRQGQKNFLEFGACSREMIENVKAPNIDELRDDDWRFLD